MGYKNVKHYRSTVHRYLDAIWQISSKKYNARSNMYKLLSQKMNLDIEDTHASKFTRSQCKEAIKILRPMYIQLFGKDLEHKEKKEMFYSDIKVKITDLVYVIVHCKSKKLNKQGVIVDREEIEKIVYEQCNNLQDNSYEILAKNICEQVLQSYQVSIKLDNEEIIYEEIIK